MWCGSCLTWRMTSRAATIFPIRHGLNPQSFSAMAIPSSWLVAAIASAMPFRLVVSYHVPFWNLGLSFAQRWPTSNLLGRVGLVSACPFDRVLAIAHQLCCESFDGLGGEAGMRIFVPYVEGHVVILLMEGDRHPAHGAD
jgi:hypothetical protein